MAGPSTPSIEVVCYECGEAGHVARVCPPKRQAGRGPCFTCGQTGHYCHTCPVPYCASCDKHHLQKDCPRTKMACIRCGEKGHRDDQCEASCPNCEEEHPPGECPVRLVTCFICESKDHCPGDCPFRSTLDAVIQKQQEIFRSALKTKMDETRTSPNVPSASVAGCGIPRITSKPHKDVRCYYCQHMGHFANRCPMKNRAVAASPDSRGMMHVSMIQTQRSSVGQNKDLSEEQPKIIECIKANYPTIAEAQRTSSTVMGASCADTNPVTALIEAEATHSIIRKNGTSTSANALSALPAGCDISRITSKPNKDVRCYNCQHMGHFANGCPRKNRAVAASQDSRGMAHVSINQTQGSSVGQNKDLPEEQPRIFECKKANYVTIAEAQRTPSIVMGTSCADANPATALIEAEATHSIIRKDGTRTPPNALSALPAGCDTPETPSESNKGVKCFRCQYFGHYANNCPSKNQSLMANRDSRRVQHVGMNQAQGSPVGQNKNLPVEQPRFFECGKAEAQQTPSIMIGAFYADSNTPATVLIDPKATHSIIRKDGTGTSPNAPSALRAGCDIPETPSHSNKGVTCFKCQHFGHYANNCLSKNQLLMASPDSQGMQHVVLNQTQGNAVWQSTDLPEEQHRILKRGKLNYLTIAEAQRIPSIVIGTFYADTYPATVLIDPEATHSVIAKSFVRRHDISICLLDELTKIKLPRVVIRTQLGCSGVEINMYGLNLMADLIVLDVHGIDVILGANWLEKNQGRINYTRRSVFLDNGSGIQVEVTPRLMLSPSTRCIKRPRQTYRGMTLRHKKARVWEKGNHL